MRLSRFWLLRRWEVLGNLLKKKHLWQKSFSDNVEWSSKNLQKNDTCWYKSWRKTRSKRITGSCIFTEVLFQNLKCNVKQACIFNLILVGIPSSLILSVKNRGMKGFLPNHQNLINMMKVIYWGSLNGSHLSLELKVSLQKFIPSPEM